MLLSRRRLTQLIFNIMQLYKEPTFCTTLCKTLNVTFCVVPAGSGDSREQMDTPGQSSQDKDKDDKSGDDMDNIDLEDLAVG